MAPVARQKHCGQVAKQRPATVAMQTSGHGPVHASRPALLRIRIHVRIVYHPQFHPNPHAIHECSKRSSVLALTKQEETLVKSLMARAMAAFQMEEAAGDAPRFTAEVRSSLSSHEACRLRTQHFTTVRLKYSLGLKDKAKVGQIAEKPLRGESIG